MTQRDEIQAGSEAPALDSRLEQETNRVVDALLTHAAETRGAGIALSRKVASRADAVGRQLQLGEEEIKILRKAAFLRDVGKAGLPDSILKKSGPLTAGEFAEVRSRMVPEADDDDSAGVQAAIAIAHHHHERMDGGGYPDRLKGDQIPLGARILAAAEAYETMLVPTAWRKARAPEEALAELNAGLNTQFDPRIVEALAKTVAADEVSTGTPANR